RDDVGLERLGIAGERDGRGGRLVVGLDLVDPARRDVGDPQRGPVVVDRPEVLHGVAHGGMVAHLRPGVQPSRLRLKSRVGSADGWATPRPTATRVYRGAGAIVLTVHS